MKYLLMLLLVNSLLMSEMNQKDKDPIAIFGFMEHVDEDGTPSRDDRKYIEKKPLLV
ncbi:MAG: hypothetical protein HC831_22390 [Chloroflexia bacterium]|nr:hypothetical protein [Chloroflexia bacterium]